MSLQFDCIQKTFGAIHALRGVSFDVTEGEAHALVGENGAGKSTLLKILAGLVHADAGRIAWQGRPLAPNSPREAIEHGVGMVYQEMLCLPNLSVAANVFCGREICRSGMLDEAAMLERTRAVLARLHLAIDPAALAETLSAAHRQLLQVARALTFDCRILVLDEPTSSLTDAEADHLFDVLRELQRGGTTILYVSHRLPEVFRLCDRITVLRDGGYAGTHVTADVTPADIVKAMVGREIPARGVGTPPRDAGFPPQDAGFGIASSGGIASSCGDTPLGLSIRNLSRGNRVREVSFDVRRGEIVGLFGLVGSGRSELLETLIGLHQPSAGTICLNEEPVRFQSPRDAAAAGVVLVPEERQRQALWFNFDLRNNLSIPKAALAGDLLVDGAGEQRESAGMLTEWRIKAAGIDVTPDTLSGGNQQKVVVAKWMATRPAVLLLDEPTKGVDVGAKFEIHEAIRRQAADGLSVLMASSDLPEVLALADRILVMKEGRLQGELNGATASEEQVMHLATHDQTSASSMVHA
ncbi:MAG: sugar ABC transporter ATP-binding protein [Acidimicrobiia bacterium]